VVVIRLKNSADQMNARFQTVSAHALGGATHFPLHTAMCVAFNSDGEDAENVLTSLYAQ